MEVRCLPVIFAAILAILSGCATASRNPWADIISAVPVNDATQARAIGSYSAGCLVGGLTLPPDGAGFQLMRLMRRRYYGHPSLVKFIHDLGAKVSSENLGTILIGDLGQPRGGPTLSNHKSHQNGLDVDIWLWRNPIAAQRFLTLDERETISAPSFVTVAGDEVDPSKWSDKDMKWIRIAVENAQVDRAFIHPAIKRHLCTRLTPSNRAWLRKLRPWYGHDDHIHLRLKCPTGHPECLAQEPLGEGDGCDSTLDWWFTEEARQKAAEPASSQPSPMPELPEECEQVLSQNVY